MNIDKGITETTMSCLYRVRNIMVYMKHFRGTLYRLAHSDRSVQNLIGSINEQSEKLSNLLEELAFKIDHEADSAPESELQKNRRRADRLKVEADGTFIVNNAAETTYKLQDLSASGLKVLGDKPIRIGDSADIVVSSPFLRNTIHKNARVVWVKKLDANLWEGGISLSTNGVKLASK